MTLVIPTFREPRRDIEGQLIALSDPDHPKRAVWVSRGTIIPVLTLSPRSWIKSLELPAGRFYGSEHDCGRLEDEPTEERLADLLDYLEPKSAITLRRANYPVVQARDQGGRVVWEQVSSWPRLPETRLHGLRYGKIHVCSMQEVLRRRARLIAAEDR